MTDVLTSDSGLAPPAPFKPMGYWLQETGRCLLILFVAALSWALTVTGPYTLKAHFAWSGAGDFYLHVIKTVFSILITAVLLPLLILHALLNLILIAAGKLPAYTGGAFGAVTWFHRNGVYDPVYVPGRAEAFVFLSPLHRAAMFGKDDAVAAIVGWTPGLVHSSSRAGATPLHHAAGAGHLKVVEQLLDAGALIDAAGPGLTPLMLAAGGGRDDVVACLLARGASVNAVGSGGVTVLHLAAAQSRIELVNTLLDRGARLDAATEDGWTALGVGAMEGSPATVKLLLTRGANVNAKAADGGTALLAATRRGDLDVIKELLDAGADVNARNALGESALWGAAKNGKLEVLQLLLDRGADVTARDAQGCSAMKTASRQRNKQVVELLVKAGARE